MSGHNSKKRPISSRGRGYTGRAAHDSGRVAGTVKGFPRPDNSSPSIRSGGSTVGNLPIDTSGLGFTGLPSNNSSQAVPNWLSWLSAFQGREGYNFDTLLSALGGNSNNPLISLISALGFNQSGDIKESQASDWNKQLLDQILSYVNTLDDRNYKQGVLNEQRLYDNPQNQLARLMGAGISRDAALQLLGQSNQPFAADAAAVPTGTAPSQSELANREGLANIAGIAISSISTFANLVSMGFNMAQSYEQTRMLSNQNALTQGQSRAFEATGDAFTVLQALNAPKEAFGSVTDATKFIFDAAKAGNEHAIDFVNSGHIHTLNKYATYSSRYLADLYKSERESQDYRQEFQYRCDLMEADKILKGVSAEQMRAETSNLNAKLNEIIASTEYINKQRELAQAMIEKAEKEKDYIKWQSWSAYFDSLTKKQEYDTNEAFLTTVTDDRTGRDWLNDSKVQAIIRCCRTDSTLNADGYSSKLANLIESDAEVAAGANALIMWKQMATADELNANPQYAAAAAACELLYKPYFDTLIDNKEVFMNAWRTKVTSVSPLTDELTDHRNDAKFKMPKLELPYDTKRKKKFGF